MPAEHSDLTNAAMWGGGMGAFGAFVRAVRAPSTSRGFWAAVLVGVMFGAMTAVGIATWNKETSLVVQAMAAMGVGFVSTALAEMYIKIANRAFDKVGDYVDRKIDDKLNNGTENNHQAGGTDAGKSPPADPPGRGGAG